MNRTILTFLIFLLCGFSIYAQGPSVPSTMDFAGLKLHINSGARKQIQSDVDALRRYDKYFQKKLKKVNLYFPIIERVFRQENLPDDFKYLVIQESALIPDAVSSSNAVGFWQFKKGTALEMGLRVDNHVDERLNIVSSSKAAAKYLKKNNLFFDNWVYALLAYNTGAGGAQQHVDEKYFGKNHINITRGTHWYVKKFLAHKVAFEQEVGKDEDEPFFLYDYNKTKGKSLAAIAKEFEVEPELIYEYNPCFKRKKVPGDADYPVIIPIGYDKAQLMAKRNNEIYKPVKMEKETSGSSFLSIFGQGTHVKPYYSERDKFPKIKESNTKHIYTINGKEGTIANPGDSFEDMARFGGISVRKFKNYNDLTDYDDPETGQVYYFEKKYSKAKTHYHTLLPGETLWQVSQKYALKLRKLLSKNRLRDETEVEPGLVLWLRFIRPRDVEPKYRKVDDLFVKKQEEEPTVAENNEEDNRINNSNNLSEANETQVNENASKSSDTLVDNQKQKTQINDTEERTTESTSSSSTVENPESKKPIIHYVDKGDTYFNISRQYNVEISDLLEWNGLHINDVLSIGQRLVIYPGKAQKSKPKDTVESSFQNDNDPIIHIVSGEETLYSIARKYKVTIKDIMEWNEKEDFVIKSGEKLKIYN